MLSCHCRKHCMEPKHPAPVSTCVMQQYVLCVCVCVHSMSLCVVVSAKGNSMFLCLPACLSFHLVQNSQCTLSK